MAVPHNHIVLTMADGREVSIIQNHKDGSGMACGEYGHTVEVWVDGEDEPVYHKNFEQVMDYLSKI